MLSEAAPRWADSAGHGYGHYNVVHRLVLKSRVRGEKADDGQKGTVPGASVQLGVRDAKAGPWLENLLLGSRCFLRTTALLLCQPQTREAEPPQKGDLEGGWMHLYQAMLAAPAECLVVSPCSAPGHSCDRESSTSVLSQGIAQS